MSPEPGESNYGYHDIDIPEEYEDYTDFIMHILEIIDHGLVTVEEEHKDEAILYYDSDDDALEVDGSVIDGDVDEGEYHVLDISGSDQMEGDLDMGGNNIDEVGDLEVTGTLTLPNDGI